MFSLDLARAHVAELQRLAEQSRGHDGQPTLHRVRSMVARRRRTR